MLRILWLGWFGPAPPHSTPFVRTTCINTAWSQYLMGLAGFHPSRLPVCPSDLDRPGIQVEVEGVRLGEHSLPPSVQGVEIKERIPEKELPEFERLLTPFVPEHLPVDPR